MRNGEPGSVQYNYQVWRQQRNDNVIKDTQTQAPIAGKVIPQTTDLSFFPGLPMALLFLLNVKIELFRSLIREPQPHYISSSINLHAFRGPNS